MASGEDFYVSVQLADPLPKMADVIQRKITEMVDSIILSNDAVPFFDHNRIHLVHAMKWTIEILEAVRIVEMCI